MVGGARISFNCGRANDVTCALIGCFRFAAKDAQMRSFHPLDRRGPEAARTTSPKHWLAVQYKLSYVLSVLDSQSLLEKVTSIFTSKCGANDVTQTLIGCSATSFLTYCSYSTANQCLHKNEVTRSASTKSFSDHLQ